MENKLWQARVKAFFVQFGAMVIVAIGAILQSPAFKDLVTEHFGTSFIAGASLLLITGLASHIVNKISLQKLAARRKTLGAMRSEDEIVLI